ncbi:MerR family transcriptional regulator [Paenimyroides baculatum]|uniref:MerR family transcriptional regulator n=1 Tax=Paenimyroides baculatum TaxID=2608000 RepID=A0A5M6CKY3_9FLAO|nr:MerR family transcriptional regulator [Paenimyroides baculatum]KAA5533975.1 MerR family transcriptional regulator [Paenimyroides baculatum]
MLINELSKRTGVPIATLRYYENYGLFKGTVNEKVKTNNYKDYDESIVQKVEMIKGTKDGGFTLAEIKKLLDSWYNKRLSVTKKVEVVTNKINEIDIKIQQLQDVRKLLADCIVDIEDGGC